MSAIDLRGSAAHAEVTTGLEAAEHVVDVASTADSLPPEVQHMSRELLTIQQELRTANDHLRSLGQKYGPKHPEIRAAAERVAVREELLQERAAALMKALVRQVQVARSTEASLTELYQTERPRAKEIDDYLTQEQMLRESMEMAEAGYQATVARLTELQLAEEALARGGASVRVGRLDDPHLTEQRIWPKRGTLLGLCSFLGLVGGVLLVPLVDRSARQGTLTAGGSRFPS
jgi:uncharacterized protein involved in exopolysaccharide biosynthesis